MDLAAELLARVEAEHPRSRAGVLEARAVDPARFDLLANRLLGWARSALGPDALARTLGAFERFSFDVNLAQARYEVEGRYAHKTYAECYQALYAAGEVMDDYLWGVYLTNILWAHHLELSLFYLDRFVARLPPAPRLLEIAPGHGGWGLLALSERPEGELRGFDISPSAIRIATALSQGAGMGARARYLERDALALVDEPPGSAQFVVCNFLVEHLEDPARLFATIGHLLPPGGRAFVSGALTAAQVDHIFELKRESELVLLAEAHGLRVRESSSVEPRRTLKGARFLPRSMAMILERRRGEHA